MSEEEIIKIIKEKIILDFKCYNSIDKIELEAIESLLDLYNKEKEKNKKIEDKIKEKIEWLEKNIIDNDYASENDKDVAENQIYILEWLI